MSAAFVFFFRNAPVSVDQRRLIIACRDLSTTLFLSNVWGLAIMKKLNTKDVCRNKRYSYVYVENILYGIGPGQEMH